MKPGDRVSLTAAAAETLNGFMQNRFAVDWAARSGVLDHIRRDGVGALVLWDGRKTLDQIPLRCLMLGDAPEGRVGTRKKAARHASAPRQRPSSPSAWRF